MGWFKRKEESVPEPAQEFALPPSPEPETLQPEPELEAMVEVQDDPAPVPTPEPLVEFGIQKAIELMRKLPADNVPLVVQVVRTTLESTKVDVASIIEDARIKRTRIDNRIHDLRAEIANLEEEISARQQEIAALEDDEAETKSVQERLELAMKADAERDTVQVARIPAVDEVKSIIPEPPSFN